MAREVETRRLARDHGIAFQASVEGPSHELHPIVREEARLIAREALRNAFRHSGARHVECDVSFNVAALHVQIRDDGRGIDSGVLDAGAVPGHFGLLGMRERAAKLRAELRIYSMSGAGTEIDLRVPAEVAYIRLARARPAAWLQSRLNQLRARITANDACTGVPGLR